MRELEGILEDFRRECIPLTQAEERAWRSLDMVALLPPWASPLAHAEAPLPAASRGDALVTMPSPRYAQLLLHALNPPKGGSVLVVGGTGGLVEGLLHLLEPKARVAVLPDPSTEDSTFGGQAWSGVEVVDNAGGPWDRILLPSPLDSLPVDPAEALADPGFLLRVVTVEGRPALAKVVRQGDATVEVTFARPTVAPDEAAFTMARVLTLEEVMVNVWRDSFLTAREHDFREVIETTFAPRFLKAAADDPRTWAALKAFHLAYVHQAAGGRDHAEDLYGRSIALVPTAEAHTFLGWAKSFRRDYAGAIDECKRAIGLDPAFGNPYNDIGAYLIEGGDLEDAIPWFRRALSAPRYCCPFYAHGNLARVYMLQGRLEEAREELERALEVNPRYALAHLLKQELDKIRRGGLPGPFGP